MRAVNTRGCSWGHCRGRSFADPRACVPARCGHGQSPQSAGYLRSARRVDDAARAACPHIDWKQNPAGTALRWSRTRGRRLSAALSRAIGRSLFPGQSRRAAKAVRAARGDGSTGRVLRANRSGPLSGSPQRAASTPRPRGRSSRCHRLSVARRRRARSQDRRFGRAARVRRTRVPPMPVAP